MLILVISSIIGCVCRFPVILHRLWISLARPPAEIIEVMHEPRRGKDFQPGACREGLVSQFRTAGRHAASRATTSSTRCASRYARFPFPTDLTGKRVLDIGAWDGWFSFEAERHGADGHRDRLRGSAQLPGNSEEARLPRQLPHPGLLRVARGRTGYASTSSSAWAFSTTSSIPCWPWKLSARSPPIRRSWNRS